MMGSDDYELQIDIDDTGTIVVVGEIDLDTAPVLDRELRHHDTVMSELDLSLDLSGVTFFDSSGVAVLVHALERRGDRGLVLRDRSRAVQRTLELVGVAL